MSLSNRGWGVCLLLCLAAGPMQNPEYEMVVQNGHNRGVGAMAYSPDGQSVASASWDNTVKLWNIERGTLIRNLKGHSDGVTSLAFSADGKLLISGSDDHTAKVWFVINGTLIQTLHGHSGHIRSIAFSPDGKSAVLGGYEKHNNLTFWDVTSGKLIRTLKGHSDAVISVAFSPDGKILLSGSMDGVIKLWDVAGGELIQIPEGHSGHVRSIAFSPDRMSVALAGYDTINIWNIMKGKLSLALEGHKGLVTSLAFSPDGKTLASGAGDKTAKLWDVAAGTLIHNLEVHSDSVMSVAFSPDGETLMSSGSPGDTTIKVWNVARGIQIRTLGGRSESVQSVSFSPDGKTVVSGSNDGTIKFWNVAQGALIETLHSDSTYVRAAFSSDGKVISSGGSDGKIGLWSARQRTLIRTLGESSNVAKRIAFSPRGKTLASGSKNGTIEFWDIEKGKLIRTLDGHWGGEFGVFGVAFSPDGKIISAAAGRTIKLWNVASGTLIRTLEGHSDSGITIAFSPDGKLLGSGSMDGTIKFWNVAKGKLIRTIEVNSGWVDSIAFSPDGKNIASGSSIKLWGGRDSNSTVKLWSVETGKLIKILKGHTDAVSSISFSRDGKNITSGSHDGTIRLWSTEAGQELTVLQSSGPDYLIYTPDGYWDGSPNAGRLVAMVNGLEAFGVDQFAIRNNRPDIILERLGSKDKDRIEHFRGLYEARLRKFGITEADLSGELHAPEVKILETKTEGKFAEVKFALSDSKYDLNSYNVFVNDVPLFARGKKASSKASNITERVELTSGENKIEVSVLNSKYVESIRALTFASYQPKEPVKGDLYFVGFGVSKYKDEKLNLQFAANDAENMEKALQKMKAKGYRNVHSRVYRDAEVTPQNISAAKAFLEKARPDDTFVLFISGHGKHDSDKAATYYYLTHNADIKNLPATAVKFEDIEDLLHGIQPRQKLFLMDTCESGETEEGSSQKYLAWAKARGVKARAIPGARGFVTTEGVKPVRSYLHERDRFIYNDLMRRSGAIVFSSSRGGEYSYEDADKKGGYFTRAILDGLGGAADANKDGVVTIGELKQYTSKTVQRWSDGNQNPTVDRDNIYQKIALPVVR